MLMLVMLPTWMNFLLRTYAWMTLLEKTASSTGCWALSALGPLR